MRFQVEPQEKKKTPKGRAKKRITYTRRFVNVTMTGGKRKVRTHLTLLLQQPTSADTQADEPQPYLVNEFRIWSLRDGAKTGTWIAHSLATPSIHHWAARPFLSPGNYDDDSKPWRTCMANQLLFVSRNKCRRRDWCTSGVFGSFFATTVTSSEHFSRNLSRDECVFLLVTWRKCFGLLCMKGDDAGPAIVISILPQHDHSSHLSFCSASVYGLCNRAGIDGLSRATDLIDMIDTRTEAPQAQ